MHAPSNPAQISPDGYTYDIFISYRHSDLDSAAAAWLQKKLERYQIPGDLRKKTGRDRIRRVFRDREELSAAGSLSAEIEAQLEPSRFLVLVLSDHTPESQWVRREVGFFLKTHTMDQILPVLVHGEPEAIYPALFPGLSEEDWPLAADFRGETRGAVLQAARKEYLRILAPVIGCSYDALVQRDRVYRNQRRLGLSLAVLAALSVFSFFLFRQYQRTLAENRERLINESRFLARESEELLEEGKRDEALLVAMAGLPESEEDASRPVLSESFRALQNALYAYQAPPGTAFRPVAWSQTDSAWSPIFRGDYIITSERGDRAALLTSEGQIQIRNPETLDLICQNGEKTWAQALFSEAGCLAAEDQDQGISVLDQETGRILFSWEKPKAGYLYGWTIRDGSLLSVLYMEAYSYPTGSLILETWSLPEGSPQSRLEIPWPEGLTEPLHGSRLAFSPDGARLACASYQVFFIADLADGQLLYTETDTDMTTDRVVWHDPDTLIRLQESNTYSILGPSQGLFRISRSRLEKNALLEDWAYEARTFLGGGSGLGLSDGTLYAFCGCAAAALSLEDGTLLGENESGFAVAGILPGRNSTSYNVVTEDGYLNRVIFSENGAFQFHSIYTAYRYYLGPERVLDVRMTDAGLLAADETGLYLYQTVCDDSGVPLARPDGVDLLSYTLSADGSLVLGAGSEGFVLFNAEDGRVLHQDLGEFSSARRAYLTAGSTVTSLSEDLTSVLIYDRQENRTTEIPLPETDKDRMRQYHVHLYAFGKEASWAAADLGELSPDRPLLLIDIRNKALSRTLTPARLLSLAGIENIPEETGWLFYALTPDGKKLFAVLSLGEDGSLPLILDLETMTVREAPPLFASASSYTYTGQEDTSCLWISPDCGRMALKVSPSTTAVLDLEKGETLLTLDHTGSPCRSEVCFTPDGKSLLYLDGVCRLRMADAATGQPVMKGEVAMESTGRFSFFDEGRSLFFIQDNPSFATDTLVILDRDRDGTYRTRTSVSSVITADPGRLLAYSSDQPPLYPLRSLNELLDQARQILDGRTLTEEEKKMWYITN